MTEVTLPLQQWNCTYQGCVLIGTVSSESYIRAQLARWYECRRQKKKPPEQSRLLRAVVVPGAFLLGSRRAERLILGYCGTMRMIET